MLIYLQDVGGASYLLPVIKALFANNALNTEITLIVHPLSMQAVAEELHDINYVALNISRISQNQWAEFFAEYNIGWILSTLSANDFNPSNANLIVRAKDESIPCIGFIDHWKGFHRVLDEKGEQCYCPDYLGVIDEACVAAVESMMLKNVKIRSVGHPALEQIALSQNATTHTVNKILLVSQPDTRTGTYEGLFFSKANGKYIIDWILDFVAANGVEYELYYRAHPKEINKVELPACVALDHSGKNKIFEKYDIFIGFNSMLLFEAHLAGCKSVSLQLPELAAVFQDEIPYVYARRVRDIKSLEMIFSNNDFDYQGADSTIFSGSLARCLNFIYEFLDRNSYA